VKLIDTTIAVDHLRGASAAVDLLTALIDTGDDLLASELVVLPRQVGQPRDGRDLADR
jgi:predicted nucleic acid-binding protein